MPAEPEPRRNRNDVTRLLYKAVQGLPEDERAAVFEYFLELGVGVQRPVATAPRTGMRNQPIGEWPAATFLTAHKGSGPNQVIPVRLSEESHRRLKQWCADHDFHMSVVVRGLVERFLDGWQEPGADAPKATET